MTRSNFLYKLPTKSDKGNIYCDQTLVGIMDQGGEMKILSYTDVWLKQKQASLFISETKDFPKWEAEAVWMSISEKYIRKLMSRYVGVRTQG